MALSQVRMAHHGRVVSKSRLVATCVFLILNLVGLAAATIRLVRVIQGETALAASSETFGPVGATMFPVAFCLACTVGCGLGGFYWTFGKSTSSRPNSDTRTIIGMILTAVFSLAFGFLHTTVYQR